MRLTITVTDDTYERYVELGKRVARKPETLIATAVETGLDLADFTKRVVVVRAEDRQRLEADLAIGQLASGTQLADAVSRLASLKIGEVTIPLTAAQHEEMRRKAIANNQTYEEYMALLFKQFTQQLWSFA